MSSNLFALLDVSDDEEQPKAVDKKAPAAKKDTGAKKDAAAKPAAKAPEAKKGVYYVFFAYIKLTLFV